MGRIEPVEPKPKRSFKDFEKSVATVALPAPVQFKALAESFGELVAAVRCFKRGTVNSSASAFFQP
jgi:hypothetical protein